ncbi:hypothetical protein M9Y10_032689 [Tritrichomonas musculus]|uniref:DUF3447 domain-containing protein n=1 Tax=Tritrichomonas musculus TaxID=1915356 RepID=A0ABR2GYD1_9EUKA
MLNIFQNEMMLKLYVRIQKNLLDLEPNSSDESILQVINQIPDNILKNKDDLMTICSLFSYYGSISFQTFRNCIKLFDYINPLIKTYLKNESSFLWEIFGKLLNMKLLMHEEGLITIDQIILSSRRDFSSSTASYFLPEIFNEFPAFFSKGTKHLFVPFENFTKDDISELKRERTKQIKWIRDSYNFFDINYRQIEKDQLRLSIKIDDIDTFQKVVSGRNLPFETKVKKSMFDFTDEMTLIEYSAYYNAMNIFKFLIMNDADVQNNSIFYSIRNRNFELFHIIESSLKKDIGFEIINHSILSWSDEIIEYEFDKNCIEIDTENDERILNFISLSFRSLNFVFFERTILPFLRRNPRFVEKNIQKIISSSFYDQSCFFLIEFLKIQRIDINSLSKSLIFDAITSKNSKAISILLENKKLDLNYLKDDLTPLQFAIQKKVDLKIIEMICNHPKVDVNFENSDRESAIDIALFEGHFLAAKYLFENFKVNVSYSTSIISTFVLREKLITAEMAMKYFYENNYKLDLSSLILNLGHAAHFPDTDYVDDLKTIYNKVVSHATVYSKIKRHRHIVLCFLAFILCWLIFNMIC